MKKKHKIIVLFLFVFMSLPAISVCEFGIVSDSSKIYDITYQTAGTDGKQINASGIIMVPAGEGPFPVLSCQHGTLFSRNVAPTYFESCPEAQVLYELAVKSGYIVVMADYIGLGKEGKSPHPYFHAETEGTASRDMLIASMDILKMKNVKYNGRLFLAGYSQGGHVTASLQRLLENSREIEFNITAAAIMAAPFDIHQLWLNHYDNPVAISSAVTSLMVKTFYDIYGIGDSYSEFFKSPYDKLVPELLDYGHPEEEVINTLKAPPKDIFQPEFVSSVKEGKHRFVEKLKENEVYNWTPKSPAIIVYSMGDEVVNYSIDKNAFIKMKESGGNVKEIILGANPDHANGFVPAIQEALEWFASFK
ncbi:MAG: hypothetical protein NTV87_12575 [Ignavibacteriae bacterium]|nr:hypothetical protein [Ignavibacteriota bacterium]